MTDQATLFVRLLALNRITILIRLDYGACARFEQQNIHRTADIFPRYPVKLLPALSVQIDDDLRLSILVKRGANIADPVTLKNDAIIHADLLALILIDFVGTRRRRSGCFEMKLQRGDALQNTLRLRGILHPWQFHDDTVGTLLLDNRLGYTQ